jgi:hypothetical protein
MNEALGERVHREFCWFALVLLALLIACTADRLVPGTSASSTEAGDKASAATAQPERRP